MITPKNLIRHELIGLKTRVAESTNRSSVGVHGPVVNETKEMIMIKTEKGVKKIAKRTSKFIFALDSVKVKVDGARIAVKPENRIKLKVKKW